MRGVNKVLVFKKEMQALIVRMGGIEWNDGEKRNRLV